MTHTVELVVPEDADVEGAESGTTVALEVAEDQSVLGAARDAGVWLPADCQRGWCTTCAGKLLEGELDHSRARRYFEADEEEGFALLCTALPRSDCRVEVAAHGELLRHRADHDRPPGNAKLND
ncbi:2Fe-2S iron-sulfur cluster-binding protein [Halorarum salinum]|uniref:2Fe-2S iron-sulfur cluster binding domain-containing protein n=1 Tax=Halorarum salinum TaxID=2743089 RepID=A0A7D5QKX9_9EURY|nr:2Fe-2S iron-sulfur cluster-binding protein [Halobaculum salinum]QLG62465.1 2Fe-2S iron-sulfur cluster binding domain-containing protein [Halobaculum salinum]